MGSFNSRDKRPVDEDECTRLLLQTLHDTGDTRLLLMATVQGLTDAQVSNTLQRGLMDVTSPVWLAWLQVALLDGTGATERGSLSLSRHWCTVCGHTWKAKWNNLRVVGLFKCFCELRVYSKRGGTDEHAKHGEKLKNVYSRISSEHKWHKKSHYN